MPVTIIVEPNASGHRFEAVANVARLASRTGEVYLLTSVDAAQGDEFEAYLSDLQLKVDTVFDEAEPPTRAIVEALAAGYADSDVGTVVLMDADQSLKRWWVTAPRRLRRMRSRPRIVFMLTRYPAKLAITDWFGWLLRSSKATLALLAMASGSLHRVAGFAGRDDMSRGWLVKRTRDPAVCVAHSRDRVRLRHDLGLPSDRRLVGIFGGVSERKHPQLVHAAALAAGDDADLLLAGSVAPEVAAWIDSLSAADRARLIVRDGFHPNELLDQLVASVDVVATAMTNNGPSGIMGKALAAGVPVVSAGSLVRARELAVTGNGAAAELTVSSFADALRRVLDHPSDEPWQSSVPLPTGERFAAALLGVDLPA
ncbi:MAG TPA: glycosyltransferase [Jatrophihabitantaceae bacterium]|nr:glycosyltransferase [Jatrophihabitantaceae bacterium]